MSTQPELIDATTVAEQRGVSKQAVYKAMNQGRLNDHRIGHMRLVVVDDLLSAFLQAGQEREGQASGKSE